MLARGAIKTALEHACSHEWTERPAYESATQEGGSAVGAVALAKQSGRNVNGKVC